MNKKILIGSIIAVVILVLSSFSSVVGKVSSDEELVEFNVEFCGLGRKHTVKLTQEQADEIELLFDDIEQRLSEVETRDETEEIFKEAVVELDKYGLLGGLGVKQAQKLVTQRFQNKRIMRFMERVIDRNHHLSSSDFFCLIAGNTHNLNFFSPLYPLYQYLWQNFDEDDHIFVIIAMLVSHFSPAIYTLRPLKIFSQIAFGHSTWTFEHGTDYYPAKGWVISFSLVGKTEWDGESLWGQISVIEPCSLVGVIQVYYYIGVKGFSGINIYNSEREENFFLGTALQSKLDYKLPEY